MVYRWSSIFLSMSLNTTLPAPKYQRLRLVISCNVLPRLTDDIISKRRATPGTMVEETEQTNRITLLTFLWKLHQVQSLHFLGLGDMRRNVWILTRSTKDIISPHQRLHHYVPTYCIIRIQCIQKFFSQTLFDFKKSISGLIELKFSGKTLYAIL